MTKCIIVVVVFFVLVSLWNYCHPPHRMNLGPEENLFGYKAFRMRNGSTNTVLGISSSRATGKEATK